jgi:translation initiation factor IF-2
VSKVRVSALAKELGVTSKVLLERLNGMGEYVKSASSTVEAPWFGATTRSTLPRHLLPRQHLLLLRRVRPRQPLRHRLRRRLLRQPPLPLRLPRRHRLPPLRRHRRLLPRQHRRRQPRLRRHLPPRPRRRLHRPPQPRRLLPLRHRQPRLHRPPARVAPARVHRVPARRVRTLRVRATTRSRRARGWAVPASPPAPATTPSRRARACPGRRAVRVVLAPVAQVPVLPVRAPVARAPAPA